MASFALKKHFEQCSMQNIVRKKLEGYFMKEVEMQLTSGAPVPDDRSHTKLKENGQQQDYVVLSPEERAKGFVRPVRRTYIHAGKEPVMNGPVLIKAGEGGCGTRTTMGQAIAETYARDPKFYDGTFCCTCGVHKPLDEFVWEGTREQVGS